MCFPLDSFLQTENDGDKNNPMRDIPYHAVTQIMAKIQLEGRCADVHLTRSSGQAALSQHLSWRWAAAVALIEAELA